MDNLLYRAWNKKEKRMYPVISINIIEKVVVVDTIAISKDYNDKIPTLEYSYPRETLLLRYTGKNDKNKKKIFEGDIVKWKVSVEEFLEGPNAENLLRNDYIKGIVEWDKDECGFKISQFTDGMFIYNYMGILSENYTMFYDEEDQARFNWGDVEVIGNRYENDTEIQIGNLTYG